jgi:methylglutaconyl-CoA hydratase
MPTHYDSLRVAHADGVATITLHRPDKRNALTAAMMDELLDALDFVDRCRCGVVVLTGAGGAFCAGLDLDHLKTLMDRTPEQHLQDSNRVKRLMRRLYDFPKPTIAAVNGAAVAGGAGLVSVCDFAYAVPEAKLGFTEVRIGFIPAIVSSFLVAQAGERVARDLLLTGRIIKADEALAMGLVNAIVPPEELAPHVGKTAQMLLANSPTSLRATKKLLSTYANARLDFELQQGAEENAVMRTEPDFAEGVTSFLEKRAPVWPSTAFKADGGEAC